MEETRGEWGVGFEGKRVGEVACGIKKKKMSQVITKLKKSVKKIHLHSGVEGGVNFMSVFFFHLLSPLPFIISAFVILHLFFISYYDATTSAFEVLPGLPSHRVYFQMTMHACERIHHQPLGHAVLPSQNKPHLLPHNKSFLSMS